MVFVANGIAAALPATLFLFFVADVLQLEAASGALLALYFVAGAASLPLWVKLAARFGRVRGLAGGDGAVDHRLRRRQPARERATSGRSPPICVASGLALGADLALPAAIAADLGERQGQAGACFGVWNFVAKLNLALAAGLALPLLGLARLRAGRWRRTGFPHLRLCLVAACFQGAGRTAALALAPFPGDLT